MMEIESLRKHCFENKPASLRCARQKTATPEEVIRMNYNENPYGMSARARELLLAAASEASQYQDLNSVELRQAIGNLYGLGEDNGQRPRRVGIQRRYRHDRGDLPERGRGGGLRGALL